MLDDLKEAGSSSVWAEEKLHQILNYRYYAHLPTVITSTLVPESFAKSYPSLWNKLLDKSKCQIHVLDMPPYRHAGGSGKRASGPRKPAAK
jgi:DNA replication protein DnaC